MKDNSQALQGLVQDAFASKQPLSIKGSGSKDFYGLSSHAQQTLTTKEHHGIVEYEPNELVLTARAGTTLSEIQESLAVNGQMLSCESPHFSDKATFGGLIGSGLSGPRRPYGGSISDLILGCKIINGKGEILNFGGKVMKNVAGYDTSRLMAGSLGCLGVILEATVKVVPQFKAERSFQFILDNTKVSLFVNKLTSLGYPISASVHLNNQMTVRFSAGLHEINNINKQLAQDFELIQFEEVDNEQFWFAIREQKSDFFNTDDNLWRLSLSPNNPKIDLPGEVMQEWNGAQRWLKTDADPELVFKTVSAAGGTACLFKAKGEEFVGSTDTVFQPLPAALMAWHTQLKHAFDPAGILNPGRMYRDL